MPLEEKAKKRKLGIPEGWSGQLPTKHPSVDRSNVLFSSITDDKGKTYAIPTMIEGMKFTGEQAANVAKSHGLDKYPSFKTVEEAESWIQKHHGDIDEEGKYKGE